VNAADSLVSGQHLAMFLRRGPHAWHYEGDYEVIRIDKNPSNLLWGRTTRRIIHRRIVLRPIGGACCSSDPCAEGAASRLPR